MQQHSVPVKFRNHAADALDLLLVTRRTQQFSVLLDLFIYFHARLAHAIRPRLSGQEADGRLWFQARQDAAKKDRLKMQKGPVGMEKGKYRFST